VKAVDAMTLRVSLATATTLVNVSRPGSRSINRASDLRIPNVGLDAAEADETRLRPLLL